MLRLVAAIASLVSLFPVLLPATASAVPAFPGAEGFASDASGGRGGDLYIVTVVDAPGQDSDYLWNEPDIPGTLRHAVDTATGPRTILFKYGGVVTLKRPIIIDTPDITIAGHTASGDGVLIRNNPLGLGNYMLGYSGDSFTSIVIQADNVILRNLRIRPGPLEENPDCTALDAVPPMSPFNFTTCVDAGDIQSLAIDPGSDNVMLDRLSLSWGSDELIDISAGTNVTLQRSIIADGLNYILYEGNFCRAQLEPGEDPEVECPPGSFHGKGVITGDSFTAGTLGLPTARLSMHKNFWTHLTARTPQAGNHCLGSVGDPLDCAGQYENNVAYNWFDHGINLHSLLGHHYSRVASNYVASGPDDKVTSSNKGVTGITMNDWNDHPSAIVNDPIMAVGSADNFLEDHTVGLGTSDPVDPLCVRWEQTLPTPAWVACDVSEYPLPPLALPPLTTSPGSAVWADVSQWGARQRLEADGSVTEVVDPLDALVLSDFLDAPAAGGRALTQIKSYADWAASPRPGWATVSTGTAYDDTDGDGMPDTWEIAQCLDETTANHAGDPDGDDYTNLEEFLNGTGATDLDDDGFPDHQDNCPEVSTLGLPAGAEQADDDGDGFGDACDCDYSGDGDCDNQDQARFNWCISKQRFPDCAWADVDQDLDVDAEDQAFFDAAFADGLPGPGAAACAP